MENKEYIDEMQNQIKSTKEQMSRNVEMATKRGDDLNQLDQRTHNLQESANVFTGNATKIKRKMWLEHKKTQAIIGIVVAAFILLVIIVIVVNTTNKNE
ncbi:hypothetical protein A3Q56_00004 [Intoshia linei]|uniref:V-SNARE coiled-coil homology domain-containing protein n=1 Tax=Intoshia linei TaxID=1819745 RepID=A0A177BD13_9BILA|nr:hypothetical protein A3Q56_00004 [Intoshia linei]